MRQIATAETRTRVAVAVGEIETTTSAEIVVVLRASSGQYRAADLLFGAVTALVLLCVFLYHPAEFDFTERQPLQPANLRPPKSSPPAP